ncbi:MAG: hypothetical protein FWE37_06100 [Spirochaetaceae bacterium]|nr:hypothetical protein [Spirochaetaceae bacterium]
MATILMLILLVISNIIIYIILSNKIKKKLDNNSIFLEQQNKLDGLVNVLHETVDGQVTLIEAKIHELRKVIDLATRKISLLEKEAQNFERSREVYSELRKLARPAISAVVQVEDSNLVAEVPDKVNTPTKNNFNHSEQENDPEKEAIALYREGKDIGEIATILNMPLASVNLIINMRFKS